MHGIRGNSDHKLPRGVRGREHCGEDGSPLAREEKTEVLRGLRGRREPPVYLANHYEDVEVSGFSLPEWDFNDKAVRQEFIELLREVSPDFVRLAPPCRKWSAMQRLNLRTNAQRERLQAERSDEEESHLTLVKETADVTKEDGNNYACEHAHGADSWRTTTMKSMKGYYEAICDRRRTGLRVDGGYASSF